MDDDGHRLDRWTAAAERCLQGGVAAADVVLLLSLVVEVFEPRGPVGEPATAGRARPRNEQLVVARVAGDARAEVADRPLLALQQLHHVAVVVDQESPHLQDLTTTLAPLQQITQAGPGHRPQIAEMDQGDDHLCSLRAVTQRRGNCPGGGNNAYPPDVCGH